MNRARFLIVIMLVSLIVYSGCANTNCSILKLATDQVVETDQELKEIVIEQVNDSLIITTISCSDNTYSFLSESVEIEERRVVLYNVHGQMDADINWTIPMSANEVTIFLPIGKDCFVHINGNYLLFPKEIE